MGELRFDLAQSMSGAHWPGVLHSCACPRLASQRRAKSGSTRPSTCPFSGPHSASAPPMEVVLPSVDPPLPPQQAGSPWRLLPAAQAMDVDGERFDGDGVEAPNPGRHHATAAGPDALHDRLLATAVEPDFVPQIGRALVLLSRAVGSMAACALIGEHLLAAARGRGIGRIARERQDVFRGIRDVSVLEQLVEPVARHLNGARVLVIGPHPVADRLVNVLDCPAPDPIVVIEIWIPNEALGTAAVTGRAVGLECSRAPGHGEAQEVWVARDLIERSGRELIAQAALHRPGSLDLIGDGGALAVAKHAFGIAHERREGRIDQPVANGPDDRGIEGQEPPSRQRLVELLDAVPLVPGRLDARHRIDVALLDGHRRPPSEKRLSCRSSARRCASSKRGLLPGHSAYTTTARNMAMNIKSDTTWLRVAMTS